jgi:hypothetical protein
MLHVASAYVSDPVNHTWNGHIHKLRTPDSAVEGGRKDMCAVSGEGKAGDATGMRRVILAKALPGLDLPDLHHVWGTREGERG